jgi:ubiquinone/menaquinone biosynthesis C-methylase UbiE
MKSNVSVNSPDRLCTVGPRSNGRDPSATVLSFVVRSRSSPGIGTRSSSHYLARMHIDGGERGLVRELSGSPAEIYERHSLPRFGLMWARDLVDHVSPAPGQRALDVACGTGAVTRVLAERMAPAGYVVGLDVDPGMLTVGRGVLRHPNVVWLTAEAQELPFAERVFDLVFCQQGLQFFADQIQALREMRRVLRPGGRLGISCWRSAEDSPPYAAIQRALARRVGTERAALPRFALSDGGQLRTLIEDAGFRDVSVHRRTMMVEWSSTDLFVRAITAGAPTMMGALGEQEETTLTAIAAEVARDAQAFLREDGVLRFPMGNHHVTARA